MDAEQQRLEVEPAGADDDDLTVDDAALGQRRGEGCDELGEVAIHRLLVAALQHDLVAVAKQQRPKAVPLGLELPAVAARQGVRGLGEHGRERRIEGQAHGPILTPGGESRWRARRRRAPRLGAWQRPAAPALQRRELRHRLALELRERPQRAPTKRKRKTVAEFATLERW